MTSPKRMPHSGLIIPAGRDGGGAFTLVIYDIPEDRIRNRLASICKDYGLDHIQFSGFAGPLSRNRREELFLRMKKATAGKEANIQVFAICEKDLACARRHIFLPGLDDGK